MSKEYVIKEGDQIPVLKIRLRNCDGTPLDLTPFEDIRIVVAPCVKGRRLIDAKPVIRLEPYTEGWIEYHWEPGETKAGTYLAEAIALDSTGKPMTLPGGGYGDVRILPRL